jgi:uncharacterized protein YbbC (DUF1343 family)
MSSQKTLFGIDKLLEQASLYKNHKIGLVTNNAAITSCGELSRVALLKAGFKITGLFSPEHGLNAKGADGELQENIKDDITGLPVISLYGEKLIPKEYDLNDIDCIVFDIPDVGTRFYTYLWTLTYVMEACAAFNKPLLIADRPDPLGGNLELTEGPMLDETNCSSFIGRWNIPIRHSCTYGELANYFSVSKKINADISVIKIENWNRDKKAGDEWSFIPTSPAIADIETAMLYPGMGLIEGINVNEGRGTETPFKIVGAPWINPQVLLNEFSRLSLQGVKAGSIDYTPADSVYANEICHGLKLMITDTDKFKPVLTGLELIKLIQNLFSDKCEERLYKTVANPTGKNHLDKLTGVFNSFGKIKSGGLLQQYYTTGNWKEDIRPYLLY